MKYRMLEAAGVELEYAIVDAETLEIVPAAGLLLMEAGEQKSEQAHPPLAWSNELVMHVIELKNPQPVRDLGSIAPAYRLQVSEINRILSSEGLCLLPGGAHPWMDPMNEARLWEQEQGEIYQAYDRIFGCKGHGWSNLQSAHLNLSYANDREFRLLHAALRAILPLIPALSASTPYLDGQFAGAMDARMRAYARNQVIIPSIGGDVVPEIVRSQADYHRQILEPMYRDIAPHDPDKILQEEWLNSRGLIPKFSRDSFELRVIDLQERPEYDLVIALALLELSRSIVQRMEEDIAFCQAIEGLDQAGLIKLYQESVTYGSACPLEPGSKEVLLLFREIWDFPQQAGLRLRDIWLALLESPQVSQFFSSRPEISAWYSSFLRRYQGVGSCAELLFSRLGRSPERAALKKEYHALAQQMEEWLPKT